MSIYDSSAGWAAWDCPHPATCIEQHCARCGQHTGGQGDTAAGFHYAGTWYPLFRIAFFCSEVDMTAAMREGYGHELWIAPAIEEQRRRFRPDRRKPNDT